MPRLIVEPTIAIAPASRWPVRGHRSGTARAVHPERGTVMLPRIDTRNSFDSHIRFRPVKTSTLPIARPTRPIAPIRRRSARRPCDRRGTRRSRPVST